MNPSAVLPFVFADQQVRALTIDGDPWFVAKDVCEILDLENVTKAVSGLEDDELALLKVRSGGQDREMNCISESGLYTLIIRSNKPQAKPFRKWVTAEVLPTIRKTGGYAMPGSNRKRADIFHHRGPLSDSGLDIRYTLDLTKIITNPKPNTLALLQRLTGIDTSDLPMEDEQGARSLLYAEQQQVLADFAAANLVADAQGVTLFAAIRQRLQSWYATTIDTALPPPSVRALSSWLRSAGYVIRKPSGNATVYGLRLVEVM